MSAKPTNELAHRGAAQIGHTALRNELRKLDKMAKGGLMVDPIQRALLAKWADQLQALAVHGGEEPPDLFTAEAAKKGGR